MPARAFLMRCLLVLTLLVNGTASLWSSSVMAITQVQHAAQQGGQVSGAQDEECAEEESAPTSTRSSHNDCDCSLGSCGCEYFPSAATAAPGVPFMARHMLAAPPVACLVSHVPLSTRTPVFRPPIG